MQKIFYALTLLATLYVTKADAALYPVSLEEKVTHATQIVEGIVESQYSFWNPAHTAIFTSNHIHITRVFGGAAPASGYMDVMTVGGRVDETLLEASDLLHLNTGDRGIFFLYPNSIGLIDPATGNVLYDVWSSGQGAFKYNPVDGSASAPFVRYSSITEELYPALEAATGHTLEVKDAAFQPYNNTGAKGTATITTFTPTTVRAGAFDDVADNLLTINGSGFSNSPSGSCAIFFDDADDGAGGNNTSVAYNDVRVVSWTDAQIKVRVPTRAGSGTFYITNSAGTSIASATINVEFATLSAVFTFSGANYAKEINLMNTNSAGGYTIQYNNSTAGAGTDFSTSAAKATFQRALTTWKTLAGFNVTESATATSTQTVANDGINVVEYDNTNTGQTLLASGTLAVCYSWTSFCSFTPSTTEGYQKTGFDIVVRSSASAGTVTFTTGPCAPTTSEYDLETVLLHELGHAISLAHIIDPFEGSATFPNTNPAKVMHFAATNGLKRVSPDNPALTGAQYLIAPGYGGHTYPGPCTGTFTAEMTPLTTSIDSHDECPATFTGTPAVTGTTVSFDLSKATSNKSTDPQYTALTGTGAGVTNTVFYPIITNSSATGASTVRITVSGYTTTPSTQAACSGQGVELAVFQASSCPAGQAYPTAVAYRTITGNGTLTNITGLSANTRYLIVMDGIANTFASYTLSFAGSTALPIEVISFTGRTLQSSNQLAWSLGVISNIQLLEVQRSTDGSNFSTLSTFSRSMVGTEGNYSDNGLLPQTTHYRLKLTEASGEITYTNVVTLRRTLTGNISIAQAGSDQAPTLIANMGSQENVTVTLTDVSGKALWTSLIELQAGGNSVPLAVPHLASGMYFLRVDNAAGSHLFTTRLLR